MAMERERDREEAERSAGVKRMRMNEDGPLPGLPGLGKPVEAVDRKTGEAQANRTGHAPPPGLPGLGGYQNGEFKPPQRQWGPPDTGGAAWRSNGPLPSQGDMLKAADVQPRPPQRGGRPNGGYDSAPQRERWAPQQGGAGWSDGRGSGGRY